MVLPTVVILDRDGVINRDRDDYIKSVDEWQPEEGAIDAIAKLSRAGVWIGVATNQSGLARGLFSSADLDQMHLKLRRLVGEAGGTIHAIAHCYHLPADQCDCRKPKSGLIFQLQAIYGQPFVSHETWMVGDTPKDLEAAAGAGIQAVMVRTGKGASFEKSHDIKNPVYDSLAHWVSGLPFAN